MLALQRTAGNAAARRMLARDPTTVKPPTLDASLDEYVRKEDWLAVCAVLRAYPSEAERRRSLARQPGYAGVKIAEYIRSPYHAYLQGLEPVVQAVLEPWLDRELATAVKTKNWAQSAWLLRAYHDAVVLAKVREVEHLGGAAAIAGVGQWVFGQGDMLGKVYGFLGVEKLTGTSGDSGLEPGATTPEGKPVTLPGGGSVTTDRDVSLGKPGPGRRLQYESGSFGFEYHGPDARQVGWLQFISLEAETFDKHGKHMDFVTSVKTRFEGKRDEFSWGTPTEPVWYLDTSGGKAPLYGAEATEDVAGRSAGDSGSHLTRQDQTAIFDRPTVDPKLVKDAFDDDDVAKLVVHLNFHDYLVRGMDVLFENTMTVEFSISSARGDPNAGRTNKPGTGGAASALAPEHHKALVDKFPGWGFYPHR